MSLVFLTGNPGKLAEMQSYVPNLEGRNIDVPEVQGLDPHRIVREKLQAAAKQYDGEFIIEDTSLTLSCLGSLPGPLIKWFEEALGLARIAEIAEKLGDASAEARCIIGYSKNGGEPQYFEGLTKGTIVAPRGTKDFGWGAIFLPDGFTQTFGELGDEVKSQVGPRLRAAQKLNHYLGAA